MLSILLTTERVNAMLNGVDPKTKEKMTDENIIDNMITFLIAGMSFNAP